MASDKRIEKLRSVLENRQIDLKVILEDIHDPHNVNAIYRSCEAVGVMDVILLYMKEEFPEIKFNSSGSACKWIDLHEFSNPNDIIPKLKEDGYQIYSLVLDENAKTIFSYCNLFFFAWRLPKRNSYNGWLAANRWGW